MPKLKETPWQQRITLLESLIGKYMPLRGIPNRKELAKRAGLSPTTVYKWSANLRGVKFESLVRVLDVLKVPPDERGGLM